MATEQENLVLNVTLVDNASAGLDKLNQQLKALGGEQQSSGHQKLRTGFTGLQTAIRPLVGDFSKLSTSLTGVSKAAMTAIPAIAGVGTAILGVGGIIAAALIPIKRFAAEMSDLGQLARETGQNAATIKIFREEFGKLFGSQGAQLADQTMRGLSGAMKDIINPASQLRQELAQGARHSPQMQADMDKLIAKLVAAAKSGDATEFFNLFTEGLDNIKTAVAAMPDRGPNVAAEWVNALGKLAGIPEAVVATHVKMRGPTEEQIKNTNTLIAQSTALTRSFNSITVSVGKFSDAIKGVALGPDSLIVKGAKILADLMERIANAAVRWSQAKVLGTEDGENKDQQLNVNPNAISLPGGTSGGLGRGAPTGTPQHFSGGGTDSKLLEEENKRMSELTTEIKRLTDLLMVPTDKPQGSAFHNTPRGGAKGESNPMQLPAGEKQPGGGAAAEARLDPFAPPPGATTALAYARQHLGMHEIANKGVLEKFFRDSNYPLASSAAWCAVYANSVLQQTGHETSSPIGKEGAAAGSFLKNPDFKPASFEDVESGYGTYLGILKGKSPRTGQEGIHVGFLTGESRINPKTGKLEYRMRGGNQPESDENTGERASGEGRVVSDIWYDADKLHLRRAPSSAGELRSLGLGADQQVVSSGLEQINERGEKSAASQAGPGEFYNPSTGGGPQGSPINLKDRNLLDSTMGGEISSHKVEGSADIEVNVKRNGNGNGKKGVEFKMPKMERQSQGTPASRGPAEDISGGANSGLNT